MHFTVEALKKTPWFDSLVQQVQQELDRLSGNQHTHRPALEKELHDLEGQISGLSQSLAKPDLDARVRVWTEAEFARVLQRREELQQQQRELDTLQQQGRNSVDPQQVVDRLNRLADVLAKNNPTRSNLELSLHIDQIRCYQDRHVVVRTCKLGALAGSIDLFDRLSTGNPESPGVPTQGMAATPRRRARLRIDTPEENIKELQEAAVMAADVHRFAGLGPEWFWEDTFQMPRRKTWPEVHAQEVAAKKKEMGWTKKQLCEYYGKCFMSIKQALQIAEEQETQGDNGEQPPD